MNVLKFGESMKLKLLGKVLVFTIIPITIGIAALIFIGSTLASRGLYKMADIQLLEFAKKQASEIDNTIKNVVYLTDMLDGDGNIENITALAKKYGNDMQNQADFLAEQKTCNAILGDIIEDFPDVYAALIIDLNGKIIAHSDPAKVYGDRSSYPSFRDALRGTHIVIDPMKSKISNKMSAMVTSGITDDTSDDAVDGVLMLIVDIASIADNTIKDVTLMPSSNLFLLDENGMMLMERAFPELIGEDNSMYDYVKTILAEKNGITRYDWENVAKVTHFAQLKSTGWFMGIETDESDFYTTSNEIALALTLAGFVILAIVALIVYFVIKKAVTSVSESADIASYVAEGNLKLTSDQESQIDSALARNDEISTLASALKTMIQNLSKMVFDSEEKSREAQIAADDAARASKEAEKSAHEADEKRHSILEAVIKLEGIVNNIASASEQLSAQIDISTRGAAQQSARMTETATAMDQMNETVFDVAKNSSTSAELANTTMSKATDGAQITKKCKESMIDVKNESLKLRQNMSELAGHTQSISAVMGVITDIADQTNLLALNAAIEAARAGEAGRGFAVVADEVRKLAEKTISSTTDVANVVAAIQQSTEINVSQVDAAVQLIEEATEQTILGGQALEVILEIAEQSADGVRAIATASEEQSATSNEIVNSITEVSNIAENNVQAMQEASHAVSMLSEQAQQLASLVDNLKNS